MGGGFICFYPFRDRFLPCSGVLSQMRQSVAYTLKEKQEIPLCPVITALPLHQKTKVITIKKYDYENDGINPDDSSSLRQLRIGKQRISKELQGSSEEAFGICMQVPPLHQSCISPVC